jgi:hypothetical protein
MRLVISKSGVHLIIVCWACWASAVAAQIEFDKPKKEPLPTPYTVNATRERILKTARAVLRFCKIPYAAKVERVLPVGDRLTTKYVVFTKGVNAGTDLAHYSDPPASDARAWTAGRVRLEIVVLPLDERRSQLQVVAHFQGLSADVAGGGARERWVDSPSNGRLEDEVLRGLAGKILGVDLSVDGQGRRRILDCEY